MARARGGDMASSSSRTRPDAPRPAAAAGCVGSPMVLNSANVAYHSRHGRNVDEFHEKNLDEGFLSFPVHMHKWPRVDVQDVLQMQNDIKKLDEEANQIDPATSRRRRNQKPFFRYISVNPKTGELRCHGGGFYLYSGWSASDDDLAQRNPDETVNGTLPVYFRAKSGVMNSKVPNFSIQWNTVAMFYYKPAAMDARGGNDELVLHEGNKVIRISGPILNNLS